MKPVPLYDADGNCIGDAIVGANGSAVVRLNDSPAAEAVRRQLVDVPNYTLGSVTLRDLPRDD